MLSVEYIVLYLKKRRDRPSTGRDARPVDLVGGADVEPNFGAFVDKSQIRYATPDGGVVETGDDAEVLYDEECGGCAELSGLACFECYMTGRGHAVGGDA